jgi:hypothetical protein
MVKMRVLHIVWICLLASFLVQKGGAAAVGAPLDTAATASWVQRSSGTTESLLSVSFTADA